MNRTTFMALIHGICREQDAKQVEVAYLLAKKLHKGQTRKEVGPDGQPLRYFEHLRRVALILVNEAGVKDHELIETALLHDSIEDTEEIQLVSLLVERLFGERVASMVRLLSKVPKAGYVERLREATLVSGAPHREVLIVKAADRLDNLRTLPVDNPAFCEKQKRETREVYIPLFQEVLELRATSTLILNQIIELSR